MLINPYAKKRGAHFFEVHILPGVSLWTGSLFGEN